jgi:acylphosphatase
MIRRAAFHLIGTVQGVNLRHYIRLQALQHGLHGWARNEQDGSVTLEVEGERSELQRLYDWLLASPGRSRISDIVLRWLPPLMNESAFIVQP